MSSLQWHSILPSGAFDSSALPEDLAPALEQARHFGAGPVLLAPEECEAGHFPRIRNNILQRGLAPQRYVTIDEFALSNDFGEEFLKEGHLAVVIDREPSAAAVEKMIALRPCSGRLSYIVVGRKDWRFRDTFRSLPHFVRPQLFLDFPVSIHRTDPFFAPAELSAILDELNASSGIEGIRSFCPHFHLRRELLKANVIAVTAPNQAAGFAPKLSIVATDPALVSQLASAGLSREFRDRIEVVLPRVIGQETQSIESPPELAVSHVWLHLEDSQSHFPEIEAHLRNWGARHARGEYILFADGETPAGLDGLLGALFLEEKTEKAILGSALGILVRADGFREAGGYDPLYCRFGFGDAEFLYRYLRGMRPEGEDAGLAKYLRDRLRVSHGGLGLNLFYLQYFDFSFFRYFLSATAGLGESGGQEEGDSRLRNQFRYRMEQSRDAYLSIYKASPRVAFEGNIQVLLKPYHWVKPHLWLLKMPVYPLFVRPYHMIKLHAWLLKMPVYPLLVQPYHLIKLHAWLLKMPVYPLVVKPFHLIKQHAWRVRVPFYWAHRNGVQIFHWLKRHAWRLKTPVVVPFHLLRRHIWRLKLVFHFTKSNLWRVKQIYHFAFWLLFPVRKVYYFGEYQFEKRVLGLYGRQSCSRK